MILQKWFKHRSPIGSGYRGDVILFNDTFMNYNYPSVGIATVELLEMAGYNVKLPNAGCCGRPMISKGFLKSARQQAKHNVDLLFDHASQGTPIIGCEPSCLLTLRDEYPDLLKDDKSKSVAANTYMIDEFLWKLHDNNELDLTFKDTPRKILFHGHCHQKAIVGTQFSTQILSLPPGHQVELIDAGCCGMAGAFGYEKEHFDLSMQIGGLKLFPAIEAKNQGWDIAVMGISCRQQIENGTGKRPEHLAEVLRQAILTDPS